MENVLSNAAYQTPPQLWAISHGGDDHFITSIFHSAGYVSSHATYQLQGLSKRDDYICSSLVGQEHETVYQPASSRWLNLVFSNMFHFILICRIFKGFSPVSHVQYLKYVLHHSCFHWRFYMQVCVGVCVCTVCLNVCCDWAAIHFNRNCFGDRVLGTMYCIILLC